jgi:hypothetical protein
MYWSKTCYEWVKAGVPETWEDEVYIVPIDPPAPEPTYRPFANADEFEPHAMRFWRYKIDPVHRHRLAYDFDDRGHQTENWKQSLNDKVFSDGTPFGVKVEA